MFCFVSFRLGKYVLVSMMTLIFVSLKCASKTINHFFFISNSQTKMPQNNLPAKNFCTDFWCDSIVNDKLMIIGRNIQPALNQEHVAHWILLNDQANERFDDITDSFADSCFQRKFASRAVFWCDQNYQLYTVVPLARSWVESFAKFTYFCTKLKAKK